MKKTLLFVNGHLNVGGVEKSLIDILKNLDYEKYDVDLILFEDLGDYYNELPKMVHLKFIDITGTYGSVVSCLMNALKNRNFFTFWMRIVLMFSSKIDQKFLFFAKPLLKIKKGYDCAIAFRVGFCAEIVSQCIDAKNKFVWWHHGECNYDKKMKHRMIKTFDNFDQIVSVSKGCQTMIENYFGNLNGKVIVIPNMIDFQQINEKAKQFNPYGNEKDLYKIITIGRLSPEKNIKNVIDIAKELIKKDFIGFRWHIVGDGNEYKYIKDLIEKNKLNQYIKLEGSKSNPYPYIYYADIMVHTSLVESQCLTVLEGMALSKPCIVSESIGPKEFMLNNVNGILTSHCSEDIANTILDLISNEILYENIRNNSIEMVKKKYSKTNIIKKINELIDRG